MNKKYLIIIVFSIFFFVDPLVFFRVLVGNDIVSMALVLLLLATVGVRSFRILKRKVLPKKLKRLFFLFGVYAFISSYVRLSLGQDLNYMVQHELVLVQGLFLFLLLLDSKHRQLLVQAYFVGAFIHAITLIPVFGSLKESLSQNTAYAIGEYSTGIFTRRGTGFFNSSGQLSVFAIGGLSLGLFSLTKGRNWFGLLLIANSLFLGIGSLSRSFFLAALIIVFIYILTGSFRNKFKFVSFLFMSLLFMVSTSTFSSYFDFIDERFSLLVQSDQNDRLIGETGVIEAIKAVENYPFFGKPMLYEGNALWVWNGEIPVRPHNGILFLIGLYGIVLGFPIVFLLFRGFKIMVKELKTLFFGVFKKRIIQSDNEFLLGFLAVNLICLVEPLIETPVFFLFLFGIITFPGAVAKLGKGRVYYPGLPSGDNQYVSVSVP
jgi:hypothetical protein